MPAKLSIVLIVAATAVVACTATRRSTSGNMPGYELVWSDEFNYEGLPDPHHWRYDTGGNGWGNRELQYYTDGRRENARVTNGNLVIEAIREPWRGKDYTSARLVTKGKGDWQYGHIEVRARLPRGRGTWPAIWMLGSETPFHWPDDGEIDIMEHVGFHPGFIHGSVHTKDFNHVIGTQKTDTIYVPDCSDQFHVYGMTWDKDSVAVSMDGATYFTFENPHTGYGAWPFDNKLYLILNIAVGGNWGGQQGVDTTIWPQQMLVDYVRVYQKR